MSAAEIIDAFVRDPIVAYPRATVACFDPTAGELPRRRLDEGKTIAFLERLAHAGAPAVLIGASTGQAHLRSAAELEAWFRIAAQAKLGNTLLVALLRPEDGPEVNARLVALLKELQYPIAFVRPGTNLSKSASESEVAANMRPLVEQLAHSGRAVGLYSIPDVSGVPMTCNTAAELVAGPGGQRVVAIKVTEAGYESSTLRFLNDPRLARLKIVQGWDPHLARALCDGPLYDKAGRQRCGVTSGPMSFAIYQYLYILAAAERGNWEDVKLSQAAVTALFRAMQDDPGKFADLQRAKCIMGLGQPILAAVDPVQIERVLAALEAIPHLEDRTRMARSLDLMGDGPYHRRLQAILES
jgi:dihydrodipicolinate synthase/N-acetylneuraminate lyase